VEAEPPPSRSGYETYAEDVELRLEEMISSIRGAGKTKVMVTLECSDENVYAVEEKTNNSSYEKNIVVIETENGEGGILLKVTQPRIRGVAVVCVGGASPTVRQSIIETLTAVLDISSARISIATMKTDNGG
jgi:stage III sporulation protein AG